MAIKFSQFITQTSASSLSHIVGYNGADNLQITPADFFTSFATGTTGFIPKWTSSSNLGDSILEVNSALPDDVLMPRYIRHSGDTNTSFGFPSNDTFVVSTSGSEVIRVNSSGNVGIGTSSPASKLDVIGGVTAQGTLVATGISQLGSSGVNVYLTSSSAGNVGIGTSSPASKLSIDASAQDTLAMNTSDGDGPYAVWRRQGSSIGFVGNSNALSSSGNTNFGVRATNDLVFAAGGASERMRIDSTGNIILGANGNQYGLVTIRQDGTSNDNGLAVVDPSNQKSARLWSDSTNIYLSSGATGTGVLVLNEGGGNVGIGTSSPVGKLDVNGTIRLQGAITSTLTSSGGTFLSIAHSGNENWSFDAKSGSGSTDYVDFGITGGTRCMTWQEDGKVGIGTSSPSDKLTVNGNLSIFGNKIYNGSGANSAGVSFPSSTTRIDGFNGITFHSSTTTVGSQSERMRITSTGNVLFGTTGTPNGTSVYGSGFIQEADDRATLFLATSRSTGAALIIFKNPNGTVGSIVTNASATLFNTSSDYRLKEDLKDFDGLDKVSKIPVYDFKWKVGDSRSYGVMAHELQEVLPSAVNGGKDGEEMQGVDYSKIVPLLIKSIQELKAEVEDLKSKI